MKTLSAIEEKKINDLLAFAEKSMATDDVILKEQEIASQAAILGMTTAKLGTMFATGALSTLGGATLAIAFPPIAFAMGMGTLIAHFLKKRKNANKEKEKQLNYCVELSEKMNALIKEYNAQREKLEAAHNEDQKTIVDLQRKLAEQALIIEALRKKYEELQANCA